MKLFNTFDDQEDGIFIASFVEWDYYQTPTPHENELEYLKDRLSDVQTVRSFIKHQHSGWRTGNYAKTPIIDLTERVLDEALDFFDKLESVVSDSKGQEWLETLQEDFPVLTKTEPVINARGKMYTYKKDSLLRLYAVQVNATTIIITGGGIKLGRTIQDSKLLQHELKKIDYCVDFLTKQGILDSTDF
jgi:hypothetical protein